MDVGSILEQHLHYFGVTTLAGGTQGRATVLQETQQKRGTFVNMVPKVCMANIVSKLF